MEEQLELSLDKNTGLQPMRKVEYRSFKYMVEMYIEDDGHNKKIQHSLMCPDGEIASFPYSPYAYPAQKDVEAVINDMIAIRVLVPSLKRWGEETEVFLQPTHHAADTPPLTQNLTLGKWNRPDGEETWKGKPNASDLLPVIDPLLSSLNFIKYWDAVVDTEGATISIAWDTDMEATARK